jgi:hypothetical protein
MPRVFIVAVVCACRHRVRGNVVRGDALVRATQLGPDRWRGHYFRPLARTACIAAHVLHVHSRA